MARLRRTRHLLQVRGIAAAHIRCLRKTLHLRSAAERLKGRYTIAAWAKSSATVPAAFFAWLRKTIGTVPKLETC